MNISKIKNEINKDKQSYFKTKKDYSEFAKHFSFKPFFQRNALDILFASFFAGMFTIPASLQITTMLGLSHDLPLRFFFILCISLFFFISPIFIFCFTNKIINHKKFFKTQNNTLSHEKYIENKMMPYFNQLSISDKLLNILKVELSDEQFIQLMMDNESLKYEDVIQWLDKETKIQNIKEIKRNVTLTTDQINEYKMSEINEAKTI